jgi:hypothetical protein
MRLMLAKLLAALTGLIILIIATVFAMIQNG